MSISLTLFHAKGVAKKYELANGKPVKTPADTFKTGSFETITVHSMEELATFLEAREPGDFITAGINQTQLSGKCGFGAGEIRRVKENFPFATDKPGILIVDSDNLEKLGMSTEPEYEEAIACLLGKTDYCTSPSASSGIVADGFSPQLKGVHTFCFVEDPSQIPETLDTLHTRSVLLGYGYPLITKAGTILIRSLVDTAMKTPNQPCYEGGALLSKGITQERNIDYWQHQDNPTFLKVIPISNREATQYQAKVEQLKNSVAEEAAAVREAWLKKHEKKLIYRGCSPKKAKAVLDAALSEDRPILESDFEIVTDSHGIKTVRELLADPEKYHEATCGDPIDPDDGAGKAKIYTMNQDGRPAINSFAHGGSVYILKEDLCTDLTDEDNNLLKLSSPQDSLLGVIDRTDSGNVAVLYKITAGDLRYVQGRNCFMAWHNERWIMDPGNVHAHEMALGVANDYSKQAEKMRADSLNPHLSDKESDRLQKIADSIESWASQCRNKPRLDAMLGLAQRDRRFVIVESKLDQNPHLVGVQNGVVNLKTGELQADSRLDLVTKRCSVIYNQSAEAPRWLLFISEITSYDGLFSDGVLKRTERPHLASFLQKLLGYCLTGLTVEQLLIIMWGLGSNGKNVLLDTIVKITGDYSETVSPELLMATKFDNGADSATPSVRKLAGARLAISSESKEGQKLEAAIVKRHTGGGFITARGLHQSPITFPITHKLILMTNTPPPVDHMDAAMQGRINMFPFDMRWNRPGEIDPDPNLPDAQKDLMEVLDTELEGILLWLIQGAVKYFLEGLRAPLEVSSSTRTYLESQDSLKQWLKQYKSCTPAEGALARELYYEYNKFCKEEGLVDNVLSPAGLGKKLKSRGYKSKKSRDGMMYGLLLKTTNENDAVNLGFDSSVDVDLLFDQLREDSIEDEWFV